MAAVAAQMDFRVIVSKRKIVQIFSQLRQQGISAEQLSRVHAPIGLKHRRDDAGGDRREHRSGADRGAAWIARSSHHANAAHAVANRSNLTGLLKSLKIPIILHRTRTSLEKSFLNR
jgi:hypothetical protein